MPTYTFERPVGRGVWRWLLVYFWMAKKSPGVLGLVACRTRASRTSPRRRSRLRFPVEDDGREML